VADLARDAREPRHKTVELATIVIQRSFKPAGFRQRTSTVILRESRRPRDRVATSAMFADLRRPNCRPRVGHCR